MAADRPTASTRRLVSNLLAGNDENLRTKLLGMANPPAHACRLNPAVPGSRTRPFVPVFNPRLRGTGSQHSVRRQTRCFTTPLQELCFAQEYAATGLPDLVLITTSLTGLAGGGGAPSAAPGLPPPCSRGCPRAPGRAGGPAA